MHMLITTLYEYVQNVLLITIFVVTFLLTGLFTTGLTISIEEHENAALSQKLEGTCVHL